MINDENSGLFRKIRCPNCGYPIRLIFVIYEVKGSKKEMRGLIQNFLSRRESEEYKKLPTIDKLIFGVGKYYELYGSYPSGRELSLFTGFTQQTIWKYVKNYRNLIESQKQTRTPDGRFGEKIYYLTPQGEKKYRRIACRFFVIQKT